MFQRWSLSLTYRQQRQEKKAIHISQAETYNIPNDMHSKAIMVFILLRIFFIDEENNVVEKKHNAIIWEGKNMQYSKQYKMQSGYIVF